MHVVRRYGQLGIRTEPGEDGHTRARCEATQIWSEGVDPADRHDEDVDAPVSEVVERVGGVRTGLEDEVGAEPESHVSATGDWVDGGDLLDPEVLGKADVNQTERTAADDQRRLSPRHPR